MDASAPSPSLASLSAVQGEGYHTDLRTLCMQILLSEKGLPWESVNCNGPGLLPQLLAVAARANGEREGIYRPEDGDAHDIAILRDVSTIIQDSDTFDEKCEYINKITRHLDTQTGPWLLGSRYSICDVILFPYIHKLAQKRSLSGGLLRWYQKCRMRPAVKQTLIQSRSSAADEPQQVIRKRSSWERVPTEILSIVFEFATTNEVLTMQVVCRIWKDEVRRSLKTRLPVVHSLLPCEVLYDGWRVRASRTKIQIRGNGYSASGSWSALAKLLGGLEKLMNPEMKDGEEPTSPPWAPGGDRRRLEVLISGPLVSQGDIRHQKLDIDLSECGSDQRAAALSLRNWLLVVEELPGAAGPLDGLSLCPTEQQQPSSQPESSPATPDNPPIEVAADG